MTFTISEHYDEKGKCFYTWKLWCGPADASDSDHGRASSVHHALLQISAARKRIDASFNGFYRR